MAKVKYIPIDIYRITPIVFVGDFKDLISFVKRKTMGAEEDYADLLEGIGNDSKETYTFEASTYWNNKTRTLILYFPEFHKKPHDIDNMVHELSHATFIILDNVGIDIDVSNNEAFAYLQGYLAEQIYDEDGYEELQND